MTTLMDLISSKLTNIMCSHVYVRAMLKPGRKPHITKMKGIWKVSPVPQSHSYDSLITHRYRLAWSFANKRNQKQVDVFTIVKCSSTIEPSVK